jgi:hypothetical protein
MFWEANSVFLTDMWGTIFLGTTQKHFFILVKRSTFSKLRSMKSEGLFPIPI